MWLNLYNWRGLLRVPFVIANPIQILWRIWRRQPLSHVDMRTPTGTLRVHLRNFESFRTCFSIFCRLDYETERRIAGTFLDVGANVGIASLYFLSRHSQNRVVCFEPDPDNLEYLRRNLHPFSSRVEIQTIALSTTTGARDFYRSEDGKYSSLIPGARASIAITADCVTFHEVLAKWKANPLIVKLDVEGTELELVESIDWQQYPYVKRLIIESSECSAAIEKIHYRKLNNGYVEDIRFP
jgi:FkbM family methyltransferase